MNYKTVSTSLGGVVILILSIISFIFVPTMIQRGSGAVKLGSWNGISIQNTENSEFTKQYRNIAYYADMYGMVPSDEFSRTSFYHNLAKIAFDMSVVETAMQNEVENLGYAPSDLLVSKSLVKEFYLDDNGMYSQAKYQKTPANTRSEYKKAVEHGLTTSRFREDLFGIEQKEGSRKGGMKMSKAESSFIHDMAKKVREYKYIVFNFDDFPKEEIKKYASDKATLFDKYDFSALVYATEEEAKAVKQSLDDNSKSFDDALSELETKKLTDESGKLEKNERGDLVKLFPDNADLQTITSLKAGEFSPVMQTSDVQYMIVRCDGEMKKADLESEEMLERIFNKMKAEDSGLIEEYLLKKAQDVAEEAKTSNFDAVAKGLEKEVKNTSAFSLNYGSLEYFPAIDKTNDSSLVAADKDEEFYRDLFSLQDGEISKPHLIGSNVVLLTQIAEKDTEKEKADNKKVYENQCNNYIGHYGLAMLLATRGMNYFSIPMSQKTFIEFIEKSPKRVDEHEALFASKE